MSNNGKDSLGDRMKNSYEDAYRMQLPNRMPVILRIDGCHFHTYTAKCDKPYDTKIAECMDRTALYLCKSIMNSMIAYVQSDEISILLNNYKSLNSEPWHGNNIQKQVSVAAGLASSFFTSISNTIFGEIKLANFDCRAFILPKEEVVNYFLFRQKDCERNSVQMLARSLYSHKECDSKNSQELQEMSFKKGTNWNDCSIPFKRGRCAVYKKYMNKDCNENGWDIDNSIPVFSQDRNYIQKLVDYVNEAKEESKV